jgi:hypothetical protein
MPDDSPQMIAVNLVWAQTTIIEHKAFHRVTCQNSRAPHDLRLVKRISVKIKAAALAAREQAKLN